MDAPAFNILLRTTRETAGHRADVQLVPADDLAALMALAGHNVTVRCTDIVRRDGPEFVPLSDAARARLLAAFRGRAARA